jgi:hypothetical protein
MRVSSLVAILFLLGLSRGEAARYSGIVVRASDSRPIGGIVVHAFARAPWYTVLSLALIADAPVGECTTDSHGAFQFDLPYSSSRLVLLLAAASGNVVE